MAAMVTRSKTRRRLAEDDRISDLPDAILGDIISLLHTKDGACTQAVSSRWRHLWRSAPLNLGLHHHPLTWRRIPIRDVSCILSTHSGPGRRLSVPMGYLEDYENPAATLDGWLRSPALDNLQELEFHFGLAHPIILGEVPSHLRLPASVGRFSSTLRVASFGGCYFPDENNDGELHLPLLKQLSLLNVRISEESLYALLDSCPVLQSLLLTLDIGCSRIRIVSGTLRSIGVRPGFEDITLQQLIIEDAPCLERLILCGTGFDTHEATVVSVISAPKLRILGEIPVYEPRLKSGTTRLKFGATNLQGSIVVHSRTVLHSVKILSLSHNDLSLNVAVFYFIKCFPCLENLYIKICKVFLKPKWSEEINAWSNFISTLDISLKKIVLTGYQGNKAHVNFAKFFVLNARLLESMVLEIDVVNDNSELIERQKVLLQITSRASRMRGLILCLIRFGLYLLNSGMRKYMIC